VRAIRLSGLPGTQISDLTHLNDELFRGRSDISSKRGIQPDGLVGVQIMRTKIVVSNDQLRRLMSEIISLREQVDQAERERAMSPVQSNLAVDALPSTLKSAPISNIAF
jgi:hypothetical protein